MPEPLKIIEVHPKILPEEMKQEERAAEVTVED